ncbi:MAG: hypothetical protein KAJ29_02280 [Alphaproteobacteria bacterium]|nr:hypothetical protein [Alphaproteobacteria bacterium]
MREKTTFLLHDGFVAPLKRRELLELYVGTIIGVFGNTLLDVYIALDLAALNMISLLSFLIIRYAVNNLLIMPIGFSLLSRFCAKHIFSVLIPFQIGIIFFILCTKNILAPWLLGGCATMAMTPFWLIYHVCILHHSSQKNRGNEVSLAHLFMSAGAIIASITAGIALITAIEMTEILLLGATFLTMATLFLCVFANKTGVFSAHKEMIALQRKTSLLGAVFQQKARSKATIAECFHEMSTGVLWPVWMKSIGATALAASVLYAITIATKTFISPLAGRFTNLRTGHDLQHGSFIGLIGWFPWLISVHPLTTLVSSIFFATGSHFFNVGLEARWYEERTYAHLAVREILLGVGRIIGLLILVPLLFYAPNFYILACIGLSSLVFLSSIHLKKSLKLCPDE